MGSLRCRSAALAAVLISALLGGCKAPVEKADAVRPPEDSFVYGWSNRRPGDEILFGLHGYNPQVADVRFDAVEIIGLGSSAEVIGVWAAQVRETGGIKLQAKYPPPFPLHDLKELTLSVDQRESWYVFIGLRVRTAFETSSLRVKWHTDDAKGVTTFPYGLSVDLAEGEDAA